MSYLLQERNESCITYSTINQNPINHYIHLFFTNGSGVNFINGNPVVFVNYGRYIPWSDYYKHTTTFDDVKNHYINYDMEAEVTRQEKNGYHCELWSTIWKREQGYIDSIQELTLDQLQDSEFWLNCCTEDTKLNLSDGHINIQELNKNTDPDLLEIAQAVTLAILTFYLRASIEKSELKMLKNEYLRLDNL